MTLEELKKKCMDALMSIEEDEKSSQLFACIQELIDEYEKTGKVSAVDTDV